MAPPARQRSTTVVLVLQLQFGPRRTAGGQLIHAILRRGTRRACSCAVAARAAPTRDFLRDRVDGPARPAAIYNCSTSTTVAVRSKTDSGRATHPRDPTARHSSSLLLRRRRTSGPDARLPAGSRRWPRPPG